MKPHLSAPMSSPAESDWVQAELMRSMIHASGQAHVATALMVPVFLACCGAT